MKYTRFLIALAFVLFATTSASAQFNLRYMRNHGPTVDDINKAEALLASQPTSGSAAEDGINIITENNIVYEFVGVIDVIGGTTATVTLFINTDDGFRLRLNGTVIGEFVGMTTGSNTTIPGVTLHDGDTIRLTTFNTGPAGSLGFVRFKLNDDSGPVVGTAASGIDVLPAPFPPPAHSAWQTAGSSSATEDESNPAKPTYTNQTAALNAGSPAGTYILRYDITPTANLTWYGGVTNTRLRVRFRDEGDGSRVLVSIMRSPVNGGVSTVGTTFDSDAHASGSGFQTQEITFPAATFDFVNNIYWLEVTMTKANPTNVPGFGFAQIIQQ